MIHIFLADDDILILNRLTEMIHTHPSEYEITGQATNGAICLELIETLHPDILLLDIDMPEKNGVEVTKEIFQRKLPVKVLILSNYDTFSFVRDAMRYGAYDYLLKHQLTEQLLFDKLSELTQLMKQEGVKTFPGFLFHNTGQTTLFFFSDPSWNYGSGRTFTYGHAFFLRHEP